MNYIESKLNRAKEKKSIYSQIIDNNSEDTQKVIKLIENESTEKVKIKSFKKNNNELRLSDRTRVEKLKDFSFIFEKKDDVDLIITFNIYFYKKEIKLSHKIFFYWKKSNMYYSNINMSYKYLKFIKKSMKKLKNILSKNEEAKNYINSYYEYCKYSLIESFCNEIIVRKKSYQEDKFNKVFTRKMTLKEFKEKINKNGEVSIFLPIINKNKNEIMFHKKIITKKNIERLLKGKEYKRLALIVKSFLNGGLFINNNLISSQEEIKEEINNSELKKYLSVDKYRKVYKYSKEIEVYLNQCLIKEF